MHILLALLGAIATAFFVFRHFVDAAHTGHDAIRDARGAFRRGRWSRKIDKRLIENIEDPREAGAIVLYQLAAYDGDVTEAQKEAMLEEMRTVFDADQETADGLYAFSRMAVGEINDAGNNLKKILRPVREMCAEQEKKDLLAMMERLAAIEGPITDMQTRTIAEARRILLTDA